jgi:hypothetical protein
MPVKGKTIQIRRDCGPGSPSNPALATEPGLGRTQRLRLSDTGAARYWQGHMRNLLPEGRQSLREALDCTWLSLVKSASRASQLATLDYDVLKEHGDRGVEGIWLDEENR